MSDIDKVDKLIRENFEVDTLNSIDKSKILKSNEFGYLSNHYIVQVNSKRIELPEWKKFNKLNAEIQLRTVLQHSWAAISHELEYKSNYDIPDILKRKLYRLAGLFELADEEFVQVKQRQYQLTMAIEKKIDFENTAIYNEINLDTIKFYFEKNISIVNYYWEIGKEVGFEENEDILERNNFDIDYEYSSIVEITKLLGINTIDELNELLENFKMSAPSYLKLQFTEQNQNDFGEKTWYADGIFMITLALMSYIDEKNLENFHPKGWSYPILERVKKVIGIWKVKK